MSPKTSWNPQAHCKGADAHARELREAGDGLELDALFLDAGNTILSMNYELLSEWSRTCGRAIGAGTLRRAEAAARPTVSAHLEGGRSTEARSTLEVYASKMLEKAAAIDGVAEYPDILPKLLEILADSSNWDLLWDARYEGVDEALSRARAAGLKLIVVSNSDGTIADKLARQGFGEAFDHIVDSALVGHEKPSPEIFAHALQAADTSPDRALHVGDLYAADVIGAHSAGVHAVLLDPFGDWQVDCPTIPSVVALVDALLA